MNVNLLLDLTRISDNTGTIKLSPLIGQNVQPSGRLLLLPLSFTGATLLSKAEVIDVRREPEGVAETFSCSYVDLVRMTLAITPIVPAAVLATATFAVPRKS